jgi:hypothetical protein
MKISFLAPLLLSSAALSGCSSYRSRPEPAAVLLPRGAITPQPSLRMALMDCAMYDPFRSAYVDKLSTMPEPDLYIYIRGRTPAHAACMRALGWETSTGPFYKL